MNRQGITRLVFVFRKFVIKIPNFTNCQRHFLQGCIANVIERDTYKSWKGNNNHLAPSYFCSWFGLIQIQAKAEILDRHLTEEEVIKFEHITSDIKGSNFGIYKNRLVCVDYA